MPSAPTAEGDIAGVAVQAQPLGQVAIAHRVGQCVTSSSIRAAPATATAPAPGPARPLARHQRQQRRRFRTGPGRALDGADRVRGGRRDVNRSAAAPIWGAPPRGWRADTESGSNRDGDGCECEESPASAAD